MFELMPFDHHDRFSFTHPFAELENLERMFTRGLGAYDFRTDIQDQGSSYLLEAELPGFSKNDISVEVDGDFLKITAAHREEKEEKEEKGKYVRRERSWGSFSRSFDISNINGDGITAAYEDGVLKLTLPKREEKPQTSRKLEIE